MNYFNEYAQHICGTLFRVKTFRLDDLARLDALGLRGPNRPVVGVPDYCYYCNNEYHNYHTTARAYAFKEEEEEEIE